MESCGRYIVLVMTFDGATHFLKCISCSITPQTPLSPGNATVHQEYPNLNVLDNENRCAPQPGQISTFSFYHCENDFQHEKTKTLTIPQHHRLPEAWFFSQHHLNYNQLKN